MCYFVLQLMVDGVFGLWGNVIRHVVVELRILPGSVTILSLHVVGNNVKVQAIILTQENAIAFGVLVRLLMLFCST